jgi:Sulfotransferase domain
MDCRRTGDSNAPRLTAAAAGFNLGPRKVGRERHMPLLVIGAGFGRTGTLSLKLALDRLGLGPCHHMRELFLHPGQIPVWQAATDGAPVDWEALLAGYRSIVDWPGCHFWRELADRYPAARVILTVRDPASWYRSASATIFRVVREKAPKDDPVARAQRRLARTIVEQTFGGGTGDEALATGVLELHDAEVKRAIPAERLLVYDVGEGWGPLCSFLGVPVPDEPFPRANTTEEFVARLEDGGGGA